MWLPLALFVLAATVSVQSFDHGWKPGHEYTYLVRSRTLTSLHKLSDQHVGILMKAVLTLQAKGSDRLTGKVLNGQYAHIHRSLPDGWNMDIPDQLLTFQPVPFSGKTFELSLKNGLIRNLVVDHDIHTWELNLLKSIVSQFQVDTQGANMIKDKDIQVPSDNDPYASFKTMEDSVGGKCEVQYDISPLDDYIVHMNPWLVPLPELKGDGHFINIMKTKNFDNCLQRVNYHFGLAGQTKWEPASNHNEKFLRRSSTSRVVISGNLKDFAIQSTETTNKILISPRFWDRHNGLLAARMNLTLAEYKNISTPLPAPANPESTGNLVYTYVDPSGQLPGHRNPKQIQNSHENYTSDSVSSVSSSEETSKGFNPRDFDSSGSSSSSSISSSEENDFWQTKPKIDEPLTNPLMPNFVSLEGQAKNDVAEEKQPKSFVYEIAKEIENPSDMPEHDTLEKFNLLTNYVRRLNKTNLKSFIDSLNINRKDIKTNDKSKALIQTTWSVIRDAVTQAGTGPALTAIKNWLENDWLDQYEAADVLSRIPSSARLPTAEYLNAFYYLATSDRIKQKRLVETAGLVALGELIRYSQVNKKTVHNRYPVHIFGRPVSKKDRSVEEIYLPYLANELKAAVEKGDNTRTQTLIVALGNTGHPMILSIFEPYLEGRKHLTNFQRTLLVGSLVSLSEINPRLARSVLYKIYLNTRERHEVRCTAVFLLMLSKPSLSMLQRMAEFTNIDTNRHVNSAVKSSIESLAKLQNPEWEELSKKARNAVNLLTKEVYSYRYSHGYHSDWSKDKRNVISHMILNYIGSEDSSIPRAMYLAFSNNYGGIRTPPSEYLAMVSSVKCLLDAADAFLGRNKDSVKTAVEKVVKELNIVTEKTGPFEANLMWKSKYVKRFFPLDTVSLRELGNWVFVNVLNSGKEVYVNRNRLASYDVTLGFPTETGLPFIYTLRLPTLYKISGTYKTKLNPRNLNFTLKSDIRLVYAQKIQGKLAFVTPFDRQHYVAGIDVNFQAYLPTNFQLNISTSSVDLKILPTHGDHNARLIHYSVKPYTYINDVDHLKLPDDKKYYVIPPNAENRTYPEDTNGSLNFKAFGDFTDTEFWDIDTVTERLKSPWTTDENKYFTLDAFLNLRVKDKPMKLSVFYDSKVEGPKSAEEWPQFFDALEPSSTEPNSESRRQQYLDNVVKGIKLPKLQVVDLTFQAPGDDKEVVTITLALANSNEENKGRWLMYVKENEENMEICVASQSRVTPENPQPYDHAVKSNPKGEFDIDIRYGEKCTNGDRIRIVGKGTQSKELKDRIRTTPVVKMCEEEMRQGNKFLRVCWRAAEMAMTLDKLDVTMDVESPEVRDRFNYMLSAAGNSKLIDLNMNTSKPKNAGKNKIDIQVRLSESLDTADIDINAPSMDVEVDDASLLFLTFDNPILGPPGKNLDVNKVVYPNGEPSCTLDNTKVHTFDGRDFPLRLDNCWYVVLTSVPTKNSFIPGEPYIYPGNRKLSVLLRQVEADRREAKILFGDIDVLLAPGASKLQVKVLGNTVSLDYTYQYTQDDDVIFEIYMLGDNSIRLTSEKYGLKLTFDGERMTLKISESYLNSVRGLCGNFDGDANNDFLGPKNCILRKPELFTASYALTKGQCEGDVVNTAKSIQNSDCIPRTESHATDVINDVESGRGKENERGNWGYKQGNSAYKRCSRHRTKIEETQNKLCFSKRPVLTCSPGCSPTETKTKNYQFYCMDKNEASYELKRRIEKGANPDLSQKPTSMTKDLTVPVGCKA